MALTLLKEALVGEGILSAEDEAVCVRLPRCAEVGDDTTKELEESFERSPPRASMAPPGKVLVCFVVLPESFVRVAVSGECAESVQSAVSPRRESHLSIERIIVDISYRCRLRGACGTVVDERLPSGREMRLLPVRTRLGLGIADEFATCVACLGKASERGVSAFRMGDASVERESDDKDTGGGTLIGGLGEDSSGVRIKRTGSFGAANKGELWYVDSPDK